MNKSLSNEDILKLTDYKCNILIYKQLAEIDNLDDIWKIENGIYYPCIILYETTKNYGHWTCFIRINSRVIEHFDPYNYKVDEELKFVSENYRNKDTALPHLSYLISKSNYKTIISNNFRLQQLKKNVSTCGRWCSLRVICWNNWRVNLCNFIYAIRKAKKKIKFKSFDDLALYLTE